ncbi:MAG TPA: hypothetical protein VI956_00440 [Nitrospirota bacterium]|nr:hypothetical protein [Nitrospirota bacterium]
MKITEKNIRFIAVYFLLAAGLAVCTAYAGEMKELELNDGTVITGEIVSLDDGVYTVKSESLGTIKLAESRVRTIRTKGSPKGSGEQNASQQNADANAQAQALQQKMMNDKEVMDKIRSLVNDPEFQKILEDPEVMRAVNSGDVAALMANPQFLKLMNNRTVQEITNKVSK